jgi:hypothetical protein
MAELFEVFMVVSFGISWPMSILKSIKAKTAKGKSLFFLCMILFGYACGITSKLLKGNINYVIVFYILNFIMVAIDLVIFFRNRKLDLGLV